MARTKKQTEISASGKKAVAFLSDRGLCVAPNVILRSALFGIKKGNRERVEKKRIPCFDNCEIFYSGWELNQSDMDVWVEFLRRAGPRIFEAQSEGKRLLLKFGKREFLRSIGRNTGGDCCEWLDETIERLQYHIIEIKQKCRYRGSLIDVSAEHSDRNNIGVYINPDLATVFNHGYSAYRIEERRKLKKSLTKWLHGVIISHKGNISGKVQEFQVMSGSTGAVKTYKQNLKKSLDILTELNIIRGYEINKDNDLLIYR